MAEIAGDLEGADNQQQRTEGKERAAREAGIPEEKSFLQRKLEKEIDMLYSRLAGDLRRENERLRAELEKLRRERKE